MRKILTIAVLAFFAWGSKTATPDASVPPKKMTFTALELRSLVQRAEKLYRLPRNMLDAIIRVESSYRITAVNPRRVGVAVPSFGLGQLTHDTAAFVCGLSPSEIHDPRKNLECSAKVLSKQLSRYRAKANAVAWAVAAYNWGTPCVCDGANYIKTLPYYDRELRQMTKRDVQCLKKGELTPLTCDASEEGRFWNQDYVDKFSSHYGSL